MNKTIYVLVTLLIILGVAAYIFSITGTPQNVPIVATSTTNTTAVSGWSTYTGPSYSIQYPADFKEETVNGVDRLTVPVKSYFTTVLPSEVYFVLNNASATCPASVGDSITATSSLATPVAVFTKNEWTGVGAGQFYHGVDYVTMKNGLCYDISLFTHSANGAGLYYSDPAQIKQVDAQAAAEMQTFFAKADTIVDTFQFIH